MIHGLCVLLSISQPWFAEFCIHHPPGLLGLPREAEEKPQSCPLGQMLGDSQGLGLSLCLGDGLAALPGAPFSLERAGAAWGKLCSQSHTN